jgi:Protein of unknown function (DUF2752)
VDRRPRLALIGAAAFAGSMVPRAVVAHGPTTCPIRRITGYPCPTCGMVRSWHSLVQLEPGRALRDHPFGPIVLAVMTAEAWSPGVVERSMRRGRALPPAVQAGAAVAWFGWWAERLIATRRSRR